MDGLRGRVAPTYTFRWRAYLLAALLSIAAPALGCASRHVPSDLGPLDPAVAAYSRNSIVCTPTAIGNVLGGAVGFVPGALLGLSVALVHPETGDKLGGGVMMSFVYAGGAVFGTPFLPLSYLGAEDPCNLDMR